MKVGVIVVRKRWNNAPSFMVEGIKKGIGELINSNEKLDADFTFIRFTIHEPTKLYIDPETVKEYDTLLIPFWIGDRILNCNLLELKQKGHKICLYTGLSPYCRRPPFDFNIAQKIMSKGDLTDAQWETLNCIDRFFVIKKMFPFEKEIEIGCGQFDEWLTPKKSESNCILIDFCKRNWDEFIWKDFQQGWDKVNKYNLHLIQMGDYPHRFNNAGLFKRQFVHYRRICDLYSKIKIFVAMNESFGFPLLENKFAGNYILIHENCEIPRFHLNSSYVIPWNKDNLHLKISQIINEYDNDIPKKIQNEFVELNPNFVSWKMCVRRLMDELSKI